MSASHTVSRLGPVYSAATFPAAVWSQFKLDLKERETTKEIKCGPTQTAAADLLPNESHATANVSLLACLQKLSTATLKIHNLLMCNYVSFHKLNWWTRDVQKFIWSTCVFTDMFMSPAGP